MSDITLMSMLLWPISQITASITLERTWLTMSWRGTVKTDSPVNRQKQQLSIGKNNIGLWLNACTGMMAFPDSNDSLLSNCKQFSNSIQKKNKRKNFPPTFEDHVMIFRVTHNYTVTSMTAQAWFTYAHLTNSLRINLFKH